MKKRLFKAASLMLSALLALTPLCAFAEENIAADEVQVSDEATLYDVEHSIEAYRAVGNKTVIPGSSTPNDDMAWYVTPSGATQKTNTQSTILSNKQNLVVAKFPIPKAEKGKQIGRYVIQFIAQSTSGSAISVLKLEGTDYDFSTLNSQDVRIQKVLSNMSAYNATDHAVIGEQHETLGTSIFRNFADVTTYAKECEAKGQEYFYVIVGCTSSTRNMMFNVTWSEYIKEDTYHAYYYSFEDMGPLSLVDKTPGDGDFYPDSDLGASFVFSNPIETATAKVNGKTAACEIASRKVTVFDLVDGEENTVEVNVTDELGNTLTESAKFMAGYDKANLTMSTYTVNSSGSKAGTYNPSVHSGQSVIFRIPLPKLKSQRDYRDFFFTLITPVVNGNNIKIVKLPGDDWDINSLVQVSGEAPAGKQNIYPYTSDYATYKAYTGDVKVEVRNVPSSAGQATSNFNTVNISDYARECYANGQSTMWIAIASNSTYAITGIGDSSHAKNGRMHYVSWSTKKATPATLVSSSIENGADDVAADALAAFEYSAKINSARVFLNGNEVIEIMLDGKTVIVDTIFAECTDYLLELNVEDIYGLTSTKEIRFSTALKAGQTIPANPVIGVYDVAYDVDTDANELKSLSFVLLTEFDDVNSVIEIKDEESNALNAEFAYDADTNKYNLTSAVSLEAGKEYKAVIKAGSEDKFGNSAAQDIVIADFLCGETTGEDFADEDDYVFNVEVDNVNAVADIFFQDVLCSNKEVAVTITNEDGDIIYDETSAVGKRGIIIIEDISPAESGKYTVVITPENSPVSYKNEFYFYTLEDIESCWECVAVDGSVTEIADNWEDIEYLFGLESEYTKAVKDYDVLAEKIIYARGENGLGAMNDENTARLKAIVDEVAFYTAIEQATAYEKIVALILDCDALIAEDEELSKDAEIASVLELWEDAMESEHKDAVLRSFADSDVTINSLEDVVAEMDAALDVYRTELLLDAIAEAEHVSEIETLLSDEDNAALLGVTDLMERYNDLKSTKSVNKAMKDDFATAEDFAKAFEYAIDDAEEAEKKAEKENKKNSSGGGSGSSGFGGGDGGFNLVSNAPVEQTPFNPFVDVENIDWAKDHIVKLYNAGIINGKTSTNFAPYDNITREEFVKLIVALTSLSDDGSAASFNDVPEDSWFAPYVKAAVANGVVKGIGSNNFGTGSNATRQDIAVMIVNALGKKGVAITEETANFADGANVADYAKNAVAFLSAKGVITGDGNGYFNPTAKATRAEVAVMLSRVSDIFSKEVK